ncbi:TOBE domain-containing protein [Undibacterium flavidum]|uniref:TOBE domain-containing protein n=1 Tax=Undibacterium flavidum TaxID=2762297 RepID=A0ABR6Y817_9BURK|nr:TOBE domain-containing protein [Undibacterium flavidum]MBC3872771.1 TOBE domain-containing protein [Undibacterium flavidum]
MNKLPGRIISIETEGSIALIEVAVGELRLSASLLGATEELLAWELDQEVDLIFNEMEVAIAKNLSGQISLRNRLQGKIVGLEIGKVLARVVFIVDRIHLISAVITSRSAIKLELRLGDEIEGLVKSNEMNLIRSEAT